MGALDDLFGIGTKPAKPTKTTKTAKTAENTKPATDNLLSYSTIKSMNTQKSLNLIVKLNVELAKIGTYNNFSLSDYTGFENFFNTIDKLRNYGIIIPDGLVNLMYFTDQELSQLIINLKLKTNINRLRTLYKLYDTLARRRKIYLICGANYCDDIEVTIDESHKYVTLREGLYEYNYKLTEENINSITQCINEAVIKAARKHGVDNPNPYVNLY